MSTQGNGWLGLKGKRAKRRQEQLRQRSKRRAAGRPARLEKLEDRYLLAFVAAGPSPIINGQVENISPDDQVSGAIHTVAPHPTNADILYLGGVNGGIWKTTNATSASPTWTPLIDNESSLSISALEFDPTDATGNTLVAGNGRPSSFAQRGGSRDGLLRTTDGGSSWTRIAGNSGELIGANISGVAPFGSTLTASVNVSDNFFCSEVGVFHSTNSGASFSQVVAGVSYDLAVDPTTPSTMYSNVVFANVCTGGASTNGVLRSTDNGASWSHVSSTAMDALLQDGVTSNVEIAVGNSGETYVAIINTGNLVGLFRSSDGTGVGAGAWVQMDTPSTNENGTNFGLNPRGSKGPGPGSPQQDISGGQGSIHFSIRADPNNSNLVYLGGDRQPRANEGGGGGASWPNSIGAQDFSGRLFRGDFSQPSGSQFVHLTHDDNLGPSGGGTANTSSPHADSRESKFDANGNLIEVDDGGIYRRTNPSNNTGDWFSINGNLQLTEIHDIAYDTLSNTIIAGNQDTGTVFQPSAGSLEWNSLSTADGGDVAVDNITLASSNQSIRYSSFQFLNFFRRTVWNSSGGLVSTSFPALNVVSGPAIVPQFNTPVELNKIDPTRLIIVADNGLYESLDSGFTVSQLSGFNVSTSGQNAAVYGGRKNGSDNTQVIYVGVNDEVRIRTSGSGSPNVSGAYPGSAVRDIVLDPEDYETAFVTDVNDRVWRTNDAGSSWTLVTGNLPGTNFRTLEYVPGSPNGAVVVGTNTGVYFAAGPSFNNWMLLDTGLPNAPVWDMDYDSADDVLVVGTLGRGAFTLSAVSAIINPAASDFGDAPAPYPTLSADSGASHTVTSFFLGGAIDAEADGQPHPTALGDDGNGTDDEDGVVFTSVVEPGMTATVDVTVTGGSGVLNAWIDFNGDGDWTDGNEQIFSDQAVSSGPNPLNFSVPAGATLTSQTFARFRLSTATGLGVTGAAADGEVEDYALPIVAVNDPPAIAGMGGAVTFVENGAAVALTSTATVSDPDSADFANGSLTVSLTANGTVRDQLTIAAAGGITIPSSGALSFGGNPIGTFVGGTNGTDLVVTFNGSANVTLAAAEALIRAVRYSNNSEGPSTNPRTVTFTLVDGDGNANGGNDTGSAAQTVNITAINDEPIFDFTFPGGTGSPPDCTSTNIAFLGMESCRLNMNNVQADASGDETQTLSYSFNTVESFGDFLVSTSALNLSPPNANVLLTGSNASGTTTLVVTLSDDGGTANGGDDQFSREVTVTAFGGHNVPDMDNVADQTVNEDSGPNNVALTNIDDNDPSNLPVTITATHDNPGLISNISIGGSTSDPNRTLTYTLVPDAFGTATVTLLLEDGGQDFNIGTRADNGFKLKTFQIDVAPVNDAPTFDILGDQTVNEDSGAQTVNSFFTNPSPGPPDEAGQSLTLTVGNDNPPLFSVAPAIDFNTGTLTYTPAPNAFGLAVVSVTLMDDGGTANGGVDTTVKLFNINVSPVNDTPDVLGPGGDLSATEQTGLDLHGAGFSVSDLDSGAGTVLATLTVGEGTITANAGDSGVSIAGGNGSGNLTLTGNVAQINNLLADLGTGTLVYFNNSDTPSASTTLTVTVNDQGNTGADPGSTGDGSSEEDSESVTINITPVNDAPVNSVPGSQSVDEEATLTFAGSALISVDDVDAANDDLRITLGVGQGVLSLSQTSNLTFTTGDGTSDDAMVFLGTLSDINAALDGLTYTGNLDFFGGDTLTLTTEDLGHNGTGPNGTDTDTIDITVNPVNDPPINSVPAGQSVDEDTVLTFSGGTQISTSDVDAGSGQVRITLGVNSGSLTLSGTSGLSFTTGDGSSDPNMVFTGTLSDVNTALNGLQYLGNLDFNGNDTLTIETNDQGNTGASPLADTDTVSITVGAVNDAPVNTVPGGQSTDEDTQFVFGGNLSVSDVDEQETSGAGLQVELSVSSGILTLAGTAGITINSGADGSSTMTISGTESALNTALNGLSYLPNLNFNGSDTLTIETNDGGNTGTGGVQTTTDTVLITVGPVNDAPVNTVPGAQSTDEDTSLVFSGNLSVSDVDEQETSGAGLQVELSVSSGILTLSGTTGITVNAGADGSSTMTISGTESALNTALNGLSYLPNLNFNGSDTLTIATNDGGNTGTGGVQTTTDTVLITVGPVNDAPVNTVPGAQSTDEDTSLVFNGNLSVSDVDEQETSGAGLQIELSVGSGILTLSGTTGITVNSGADGSSTMTISGTESALNTALNGLSYLPNLNFNGSDTLTIQTNDGGNTGTGGVQTTTDTVSITVGPVNDAPVNTVPGAQSTDEDTSLVFSGNLSVSDVDEQETSGAGLQVELSVSSGILTLSGTSGITVNSGADGSSAMTISGTESALNTALNGLSYLPNLNFNGSDTLTIATNDGGNTGTGGVQTTTDTVSITVGPVNDAPVNTVPGAQSTDEDTQLVFSGNLSVSDVDEQETSGAGLQVELSVSSGILTLAGTAGITINAGADGSSTLTISGTESALNTALNGLSYLPDLDFNGSDTLTIETNDGGNTGAGGVQTTTDTVTITVGAVNDAPVNTVPGAQSTSEETALLFSGNLSVSDVDEQETSGAGLQVQLSVNSGTLTLSGTAGITVDSGADGSSTLTISGTESALNTALNGLSYLPDLNFNGSDTLTIETNDGGNTGAGGVQTTTDTVAITVGAVNDAPINTVPGAQSTSEETALLFNGNLSVSDVDEQETSGAGLQVVLSVSSGILTLSGTSGITVNAGADGSSTMTISGTESALNTALNGLSYLPNVDFNGSDTLTIETNDGGNTGAGGVQTTTDTVAITVGAVNDAPVNTVPGAQSTLEETALLFNGNLSVSDVDEQETSGAGLQVELSVNSGILTLSGTTGITVDSGADGSSTMTISGTESALNTALNGLSYLPDLDFNGSDTLTIETNDGGNTGAGGVQTTTDTVLITVGAVNDAPVNTVPGAQSTSEETALLFSGNLSVSDVDEQETSGGGLQVQLSVNSGILTLAGIGGITFDAGADGSSTMTISGTESALNTALNGLSYLPNVDFNGSDTLTIETNDGGNTGAGGVQTTTDTVAITVGAVNDAPVNTVPGAQSTLEETALLFNGNLSVSDVDEQETSGAGLQVELSVSSGILALSGTTGITVDSGADGSSTMTISGTESALNTALNGLSYLPDLNFNGSDTLTIETNDGGNTGAGGVQTTTDTVLITVGAVNDAPVNTVPGPQSTPEDTALLFSGNLSVSDVDEQETSGAELQVQLSVGSGTLTLSGTAGITIDSGADGSSTMTIRGTESALNTALNGLSYLPALNFNGSDTLTIETNDQGNTGSGGVQTTTDTVAINVSAVNDAPVNSVPSGQQSVDENATLTFSGASLISTSDVDAGTGDLEVTLSVTQGTLTLSQTTNLNFSSGDGAADPSMVFTGTLADINAALDGLSFTPNTNYVGSATLTLTTDDQGNTGSGPDGVDTDTVDIEVGPVNDAPVNSVPGAQSVDEDATLAFSGAAQISTSDIDAAGNPVRIALTVNNGQLTLSGTTGLSFLSGDGTADASMVFTGTLANVNAALDGLIYAPDLDFSGNDTLTLTTDDQGNTGSGGALQDVDTVDITVNPVNDAPLNSVPGSQSIDEEATLAFAAATLISVSDVDAGSSSVQITLGVSNGVLTLSGTSGLSFTSGDGTADSNMVFTGSLANVNAALDGLIYAPDLDFSGNDTLTLTTDDQGNTGSGGNLTDTDTVDIAVNPVNDAPLNSVPGAQSVDEDAILGFSGATLISTSDVDAGSSSVQITLDVNSGVLTLSGTSGLSFTSGDGTADANMVFTGSLANVNAALDGLIYAPDLDFSGNDTLTLTTDDQGNTGSGGNLTDTDTVDIAVNPVNDAPLNSVPGAQSVDEDTILGFSGATLISTSDVDAGSSSVQITLDVNNGVLTLSGTSGLSFTSGDGTADANMVFSGSLANVNAALDGLIYAPDLEFSGNDTLTLTTDDQGNTGSGGNLTDTDTVDIAVNAVNDAPLNSVPGAQSVDEDAILGFSGASLISTSDVDAGSSSVQITLDVGDGVLTLSGTSGLSFSSGDGTADANMVFTGSLANVNAALDGLIYAPDLDFSGIDTLTLTTNDQGNTGSGGNLADTDTVDITVNPVNDAPLNSVPGLQAIDEDTTLTFSGASLISTSDVDAGTSSVQITLGVSSGVVTLSGTSGLSFSSGDGTADATMVFTGSLANVNAALDGLSYVPNLNFSGNDTLTLTTDDQGNTGSGGNLTDTDTVDIAVNAVNDAPVNSVPGSQSINEDATLTFSGASLISTSDVDAGTSSVRITLGVNNGVLTLSGTSGLSFNSGDGTADASMVFTGSLANVNAALNGMSYQSNLNFSGNDTLTLTTEDLGNTGSGGNLADSDTVDITVSPVNDAPLNSVPGSQTLDEDTPFTFSGGSLISISDVDAGSSSVRVTLGVGSGVLTLSGTSGLSFNSGDGTADSSMIFTGSLANVNAALNGLSYLSDLHFNGNDTLTLTTNDLGNTGLGPAGSDTDTVDLVINPINDAPLNTVPGSQSVAQGGTLTLNGVSVDDVDVGGGDMTIALSVTTGVIQLSSLSGLNFTAGGDGQGSMTFAGSLADVNAALNGLTYTPPGAFVGTATFSITSSDGGASGAGGVLSDSDTVDINVAPLNSPPVNTVPGPQSVNEDTALIFAGNLSVSDPDSGSIQVSLSVNSGTLTLASTTNLTITSGGNGQSSVTVQGLESDLNTALNGLSYLPNLNFNGSDTLTVATDDLGNGGGSPETDTDTVDLTINPVNDAPINVVPGPQTLAEDSTLVFSGGLAITVSDVDASNLSVALAVNDGQLFLGTLGGVTIVAGANGSSSLTISGSIADLNVALDGLTYLPDTNFAGADTLSILSSDGGATGSGGPQSTSSTVSLTVSDENDAPVNHVPGTQGLNVNSSQVFSTANGNLISISDVDAASGILTVTLNSSNGVLHLGSTAGLTSVAGDGSGSISMSGTLSALNNALDGLEYVPPVNFSGLASLQIDTNDNGNTGNGGALTDTDTIGLNVGAIFMDGGNLYVTGTDNNDTIIFTRSGSQIRVRYNRSYFGPFPVTGTIFAFGLAGNDRIIATGSIFLSANFDGGEGNDYLSSASGDDILVGGPGNDRLLGNRGDNFIDGGDGDDRLAGREGNDTLLGGAGNDTLSGSSGNDILRGGDGNDRLDGGNGDDLVRGGAGNDRISGGGGNDIMLGGLGDDQLNARGVFDILLGGDGRDTLRGSSGDQILVAGVSAYDDDTTANDNALLSILNEWSSGGSILSRIANINSSANPLDSSTIFDELGQHQDDLIGSSGADWFLVFPTDRVRDERVDDVRTDL